jgi:hypothetical protein
MLIGTNIPLREYLRSSVVWHGSFHETLGKGATDLISHGIRRDLIGHPVPDNAAVGIAQLNVTGDSADEFSGVILFLSRDPPEIICKTSE